MRPRKPVFVIAALLAAFAIAFISVTLYLEGFGVGYAGIGPMLQALILSVAGAVVVFILCVVALIRAEKPGWMIFMPVLVSAVNILWLFGQ